MKNLVHFNQTNIMSHTIKTFQLNYYKLKKSLFFVFMLLNINTTRAQMHINGPISFGPSESPSSLGNLTFGADAQVIFMDGSSFYMLGETTTIDAGSEFFANTLANQFGTGRFIFQGSVAQTLDGGNSSAIGGTQPSLINLAINNANNLTLTNTNTRVTSGLDFIDGHVLLGSNNLEIASSATITNADETQYVVTNGTGFLAKEAFTSTFTFPVGRVISDFTPATITPAASDNFFIQVKNYTESAADEVTSADGVDRTWNIYSTSGSGATLALQHNSTSNGADYGTNGGDASAFVTQYEGIQWVPYIGSQGTWQLGTSAIGTNTAGSVAGSVIHSRTYSTTATSSSSDGAFFSKSTLEFTPLPITLLSFNAKKYENSKSLLTWSTSNELNSSHFEVETSINGVEWNKIGEVNAQGMSSDLTNYQYIHVNPIIGLNYYRINMIDLNGLASYSNIKMVEFDRSFSNSVYVYIYPNPSNGVLKINKYNNSLYNFTLSDINGKSLKVFKSTSENAEFQIDISMFQNGIYYMKAENSVGDIKVFKIVLNK